MVCSQRIVKVEYFLTFFQKSEFFTLCWKQIFENFFSNCSHLKTIWWKFVKPTGNSHKYPKFSYAERSSQKYWAISELFKFEVLAPCGRHANEVICPYPLACPWICISTWYGNYIYLFVSQNATVPIAFHRWRSWVRGPHPPPREVLFSCPESTIVQAAPDGRGLREILSDCQVLQRRRGQAGQAAWIYPGVVTSNI